MPITKFSMKLPFICKSKRSVSETPFLIQPTKIAISLMMFPIAVTAAAAKFATLSPIDLKELNQSVSIPKAVFWFSLPSPRTATEIASKPITARPATGWPDTISPMPASVVTKSQTSRSSFFTTFEMESNAEVIPSCQLSGSKFRIDWPRLERDSFKYSRDSPSFPSVRDIFQPCLNPSAAR